MLNGNINCNVENQSENQSLNYSRCAKVRYGCDWYTKYKCSE